MADLPPSGRDCVEAQAEAFRLAKLDGFDIDTLHARSKISRSTLKGWASGNTAMPAWAIGFLVRHGFPIEHMNEIFEPFEVHLLSDEEGCDDALDNLTEAALDFAAEMGKARAQKSAGGPQIVPQEKGKLRKKAGRLATLARKASR